MQIKYNNKVMQSMGTVLIVHTRARSLTVLRHNNKLKDDKEKKNCFAMTYDFERY